MTEKMGRTSRSMKIINNLHNGVHLKFSIRHKLFLTILLSSSIVAFSFYFVLQWNFDRGFVNYVNNQTLSDMETLANRLKDFYSEASGWNSLKNAPHLWVDLHREMIDGKGGGRPVPNEPHLRPPPPPPHMDADLLSARSILMDRDKMQVIGGPPQAEDAPILRPIIIDSRTVGYLGLFPSKELMDARDLLFVEQQTKSFGIIAIIMLGISILLTFPITIHLLRPIKNLINGTRDLIGGRYATRIPIVTKDELGRLSKDFNILAMTLEKNETARRQWIADISHELRTPLAVLRGEVEALQDGVREVKSDTLDPVHGEILHLQRLVNDLYELTMSDIGALTYKKVPMDPLGILEESVELFEKKFSEKGVGLTYEPPSGIQAAILGDPDRLQQLYTNLLENSLRYTDVPGNLIISTEVSDDSIALIFSDSAPGVSKDQLPHLFDRLYRTDPSRKRTGSGAGLGLAICTNIIEAHQGTITASRSDLGGLRIDITLPLNS